MANYAVGKFRQWDHSWRSTPKKTERCSVCFHRELVTALGAQINWSIKNIEIVRTAPKATQSLFVIHVHNIASRQYNTAMQFIYSTYRCYKVCGLKIYWWIIYLFERARSVAVDPGDQNMFPDVATGFEKLTSHG